MSQSTTTPPTATVRLGGQDRTVEFTLEVLSRIEERTGLGVFECAEEIGRCFVSMPDKPGKVRFDYHKAKVTFMAALVAGALGVGVEEVQGLVKGRGVVRTFGSLMNEFLSAVHNLMGTEDEDAHPPAAEAPAEGASATSTPGDESSSA